MKKTYSYIYRYIILVNPVSKPQRIEDTDPCPVIRNSYLLKSPGTVILFLKPAYASVRKKLVGKYDTAKKYNLNYEKGDLKELERTMKQWDILNPLNSVLWW